MDKTSKQIVRDLNAAIKLAVRDMAKIFRKEGMDSEEARENAEEIIADELENADLSL